MTENASAPTCVVCRNPLNEGSRKCLECGAFQHPARRFLAGFDVKSLLALVPIVTLAVAFLQDRFTAHGSDLRVAALACEPERVDLLASNRGDRDGVIRSAHARMVIGGAPAATVYPLVVADGATYAVIGPGKSEIFALSPVQGGSLAPLERRPVGVTDCRYDVHLEILEFQQTSDAPKTVRTSCDCPR